MPRRKEIPNVVSPDLYCVQVYTPALDLTNFNVDSVFEKWATIEVADFNQVPDEMEKIVLQSGLYAVFIHIGAASTGKKTFQYIYETWLPGSDYQLDNRPHFEILGEKYKNNEPDSEEEVWIPIRVKS